MKPLTKSSGTGASALKATFLLETLEMIHYESKSEYLVSRKNAQVWSYRVCFNFCKGIVMDKFQFPFAKLCMSIKA